jgi:hypothetical protein
MKREAIYHMYKIISPTDLSVFLPIWFLGDHNQFFMVQKVVSVNLAGTKGNGSKVPK